MEDKPSSNSGVSNQLRTPEDNATIEMIAGQLAELLLDYVLYQGALKAKKSRRSRKI